jgi:hypothetical protein
MRSHDQLPIHVSFRLTFIAVLVLAAVAVTKSRADELDVAKFEYVDVIETVEGSILKGVVTEQTPNVVYKLATADGSVHVINAASVVKVSKQRNPRWRIATIEDSDVELHTQGPSTIRPASGLRIAPELAIVIPTGDLLNIGGTPLSYRTSFAPGVKVGYEHLFGNVGLDIGGLVRFTSWRLPEEIAAVATHYTIETHAYGRANFHLGRAVPYAGLALGLDTNYAGANGIATTAFGFGVNVQAGVNIAASRAVLVDAGVDYHPGTDVIEPGWDGSISYFALRFGATIRL